MFAEFKKFVMRGNVLDLAVGVIIGGAFGKIIASMVGDVLMPVIGLALGNVDFSNLFVVLGEGTFTTVADAKEAGVATLNYGIFINTAIEFLIIALVVFLVVKQVNKFLPPPPPPPPASTKDCPECATKIPLAAKRCPACTQPLPA